MAQPTISMPDALLETVDTQPGNNRSKWVCNAMRMRLSIETAAEDDDQLPEDWWQDAVEMYLNEHDSAASIEA